MRNPKRYPLDLYFGPKIPLGLGLLAVGRLWRSDDDDEYDDDDDDAWQARREYVEVQTE